MGVSKRRFFRSGTWYTGRRWSTVSINLTSTCGLGPTQSKKGSLSLYLGTLKERRFFLGMYWVIVSLIEIPLFDIPLPPNPRSRPRFCGYLHSLVLGPSATLHVTSRRLFSLLWDKVPERLSSDSESPCRSDLFGSSTDRIRVLLEKDL